MAAWGAWVRTGPPRITLLMMTEGQGMTGWPPGPCPSLWDGHSGGALPRKNPRSPGMTPAVGGTEWQCLPGLGPPPHPEKALPPWALPAPSPGPSGLRATEERLFLCGRAAWKRRSRGPVRGPPAALGGRCAGWGADQALSFRRLRHRQGWGGLPTNPPARLGAAW